MTTPVTLPTPLSKLDKDLIKDLLTEAKQRGVTIQTIKFNGRVFDVVFSENDPFLLEGPL